MNKLVSLVSAVLLSAEETVRLLARYNLPAVKTATAAKGEVEKLVTEARSMRPPFVLKGAAKGVVHKTEAGLVALGIEGDEALRTAASKIVEAAGKQRLKLEGFVLQEHAGGIELIVGGKRDPVFGPTILFGSGGIFTELFRDVSVRVCPLQEEDAREMISETRASRFFTSNGFRGRRVDEKKMTEIILSTSRLLEENPNIVELDFNPVIACEDSILIADARIIVSS